MKVDDNNIRALIAKKTAIQEVFAKHPLFKTPNPFLSEYAAAFDQAIAPEFDYFAIADDGTPLYELSKDSENSAVRHELMRLFKFSENLLDNYIGAKLNAMSAQAVAARLHKATPIPPDIDEQGYAALVQYLKKNWANEFQDGSTPEECARLNPNKWAVAYEWQQNQSTRAADNLDKYFAQVMRENR